MQFQGRGEVTAQLLPAQGPGAGGGARPPTHREEQHRHCEDDGDDDGQPHAQDEDVSALVLVQEVRLHAL